MSGRKKCSHWTERLFSHSVLGIRDHERQSVVSRSHERSYILIYVEKTGDQKVPQILGEHIRIRDVGKLAVIPEDDLYAFLFQRGKRIYMYLFFLIALLIDIRNEQRDLLIYESGPCSGYRIDIVVF